MAIDRTKLTKLLIQHNHPVNSVGRMLLDYLVLYQKLENPGKQSWYFHRALDSHKKKLREMEKSFNKLAESYNRATLDSLIGGKAKLEKSIASAYRAKGLGMIQLMALGSQKSQLAFQEEIIALKAKVSRLRPIREYLEYPEEVEKILI